MIGEKIYKVAEIPNSTLFITGKGDNALWNKAELLTDFNSPWDNKKINTIEFRALHNSDYLYVYFKVFDSNIYIDSERNEVENMANSDRVELFFKIDNKLSPYYCLEIDPTPRILDFKANFYRNFDYHWNWPKDEILVKSSVENEGFIVEIALSKASLLNLGLLNNNIIQTGIYRAKYNHTNKGVMKPTWISWVDPNTEEPDFHIASSFGVLELLSK
ncbi:sugar-binding protein [Aestuariibaculum suncheonense]|uniref:Endoxylanase n=1 Tax=Aestuariibaculum suncheonense TaxID=1028745 RepID=A0A8J6Q7G2_9FLAO|nr:sugar-binding protein [Aestuariibaculum suncheonense]MBD0835624.1 endoxylanase [Aestuariibaculum suncheonense]